MDLIEFTTKIKMVKSTLINARKLIADEYGDDKEIITELRKAEGFISFVEKYAPNFVHFNSNVSNSYIQVKIFESETKEDMETQINQFLAFPNRMIIYTGLKGDNNNYFGYIIYKDK